MVGWIKGLSEWWEPNAQLTDEDISPHFWPNGTLPNSAEFDALVAEQFDHYRLRVGGLVEAPREFSFNKSRLIFASRDGPASQSGVVFRCAISWTS